MPYSDQEKQRAYFREYRIKNRVRKNERARALRQERRNLLPQKPEPWGVEVSGKMFCRSCGVSANTIPAGGCAEPRHAQKIQRRRTNQRASGAVARLRERLALLEKLGGRCAGCGFSDHRALQIDHINSDGAAHRKASKGGRYRRELSAAAGESVQVLCANCHAIKTYEDKRAGLIKSKPRTWR
jgi:hypothetical protein